MKTQKKANPAGAPDSFLSILGGRVHNLKNVSVKIPHNKLTVIVGVSGSGKSSLVFDLIFAEARRRYMETLDNNYVRNFMQQMERADVDEIAGLQAAIGIAQETTTRQMRSTIGTLTDIYAYLRLLYARASEAYSYLTGDKMVERSSEQIMEQIREQFAGQEVMILAPIIQGRKGHYQDLFRQLVKKKFQEVRINKSFVPLVENMYLDRYKTHDIDLVIRKKINPSTPLKTDLQQVVDLALTYGQGNLMVKTATDDFFYFSRSLMDAKTGLAYADPSPNTFSFNSTYGACPECKGHGEVTTQQITPFIVDPKMSIRKGGIAPLGPYKKVPFFHQLETYLHTKKLDLDTPIKKIPKEVMISIIYGTEEKADRKVSYDTVLEWLERKWTKQRIEKFLAEQYEICPACEGTRLHKEALHFKIWHKHIAQVSAMSLEDLADWLTELPKHLNEKQTRIGADLIKTIQKKVNLLVDMGLGYLSLDRPLQTLSSGEIRRIRLGTQIGTQDRYLVGVMYILDEPSIGLHPQDNERLLASLQRLRDMGNTVILIEHDKETMMAADYLIEVGPQAGVHGGHIVAHGTPQEFIKQPSLTADFLLGKKEIPIPPQRRKGHKKAVQLKGCTGHNLKHVNLTLPLGKLIVITGVSGSGKSSLINETLLPVLKQKIGGTPMVGLPYESITGLQHIDKVIEIDQTPIGRTSRSNPVTYTGVFGLIRQLFALLPQSKLRGYSVGRFSFNVKGGSCENCKGKGLQRVEMDFLPTMRILCEVCRGKRYNRETLQVKYKGKSIADVLDMTISQAIQFFDGHHRIVQYLQTLEDVGLGYVQLGQHALTLSGGEGQRVKLSAELHKKSTGQTIYILDEPTTGLHFQDIGRLLKILQRLVDKGNTVIIIEHNMDVIKSADHIIDLGPGAGEKGGNIIAQGTPEEVAKTKESHTGRFLAQELATH